ncbi:hypothetical protein [Simplicispira suum]|uniref:hypothetical protein n=1 Tax=Simplicispira suum TaxID=2109915 RepID=UPI0011B29E84|nr:hypothetical protein [Simplicispira suum]
MLRPLYLGLAALAVFIGIAVYLAPLEPGILRLQFSFTASSFQGVLEQWQAHGIALYRAHFSADFVLLVLYGAFGFAYGRQCAAARAMHRRLAWLVVWSLPVAALADAGENALHLLLTDGRPAAASTLYALAALAATAKWLAILAFGAASLGARRRVRPL